MNIYIDIEAGAIIGIVVFGILLLYILRKISEFNSRKEIDIQHRCIYGQSKQDMLEAVDKYYRDMEGKVDGYLDSFYTLETQGKLMFESIASVFTDKDPENSKKELLQKLYEETLMIEDLEEQIEEIAKRADEEFRNAVCRIIGESGIRRTGRGYEKRLATALQYYEKYSFPKVKAGTAITGGTAAFSAIVVSSIVSTAADIVLPATTAEVIGSVFGVFVGLAAAGISISISEKLSRDKYRKAIMDNIGKERKAVEKNIEAYFEEESRQKLIA